MIFQPTAWFFVFVLCVGFSAAQDGGNVAATHAEGADTVAVAQDELSADVQQLIIEQTSPAVIQLLREAEGIMNETTDRLAAKKTGGETIAAQTEIIEKIEQAAQAKTKKGGAMSDMLKRMAGKEPQQGEGKEPDKPGDESGKADKNGGESDVANEMDHGATGGASEERRVPKAAGTAGAGMPAEFHRTLDAYNRGAEKLLKP
ncbi:MAG: hypothetical protein V4733_11515 [Verrucomicrobiota bacterium]